MWVVHRKIFQSSSEFKEEQGDKMSKEEEITFNPLLSLSPNPPIYYNPTPTPFNPLLSLRSALKEEKEKSAQTFNPLLSLRNS